MVDSKHQWKAWIYLTPALILLLVFTVYPIFNTLRIAFLEGYSPLENQGGNASWTVGFQNFKDVITYRGFKNCISNTLLLTVLTVPLSCFIALLVAVFLNTIPHFSKVFQTIYFLPYVTNSIAIGMVFAMMFNIIGLQVHVVSEYTGSLELFGHHYITMVDSNADEIIKYTLFAEKIGISSDVAKEIYELMGLGKNATLGQLENYLLIENHDAELLKIITQSDLDKIKEVLPTLIIKGEPYQVERAYTATSIGIINNIIGIFGIEPINWINHGSSYSANIAVMVIYIVWNALPFKILILLGGLQSVNKQYYDAAKIDGASRSRVFWRITVPLLSPMIAYVVITSFIGGFKEYTSIVGVFGDNMGPAGAKDSLNTMVGYIYNSISKDGYGVASAAALILFLIIFAVTLVNLYVSKKKVHY